VSATPALPRRLPVPPAGTLVAPLAVAGAAALLTLTVPGPAVVALALLALLVLATTILAGAARGIAMLAALAAGAALDWAYVRHFSPLYAYQGLVDASPGPGALAVTAALAALPAALLPTRVQRPSTVAVWMLYLAGYVPAIVVPVFLTGDLGRVLPYQLAVAGSMAAIAIAVRHPPRPIALAHLTPETFTTLMAGLGLATSAYIAANFGIHALPGLGSVYGARSQFTAEVSSAAAAGYLVPWAANAINPILMAWGIARRAPSLVALGLAGQLLVYANTGFKSVLFSIVLVPVVYVAVGRASRIFGTLGALGTAAIVLGSAAASSVTGDWSVGLVRRVFATPGQMDWYYFDYFSGHPKYHLSHSFLRFLGSSPYAVDPPLLIGAVYFPSDLPSANAGLWSDAFANFGLVGIVAFTLVLILALRGADALGHGRDARVVAPAMAIAGMTFGSSAMFTTILTLGFALAVLLIAVMPPGEIGPPERRRPA
jgi:hypothetical protein